MNTHNHARASYGLIFSGLVFAFGSAIVCAYLVRKFAGVFDGFSATLPVFTRLVLNYHALVWLLPLTVVLIAFFSTKESRGKRCFTVGLFAGLAVCALVIVALRLPLSAMGTVVQ